MPAGKPSGGNGIGRSRKLATTTGAMTAIAMSAASTGPGVGLSGRAASEARPTVSAMEAAPISHQPGRDSGRSPGRRAMTAHHTASGTVAARRRVVARHVEPRGVTATTEIEGSSNRNAAAAAHAARSAGSISTALLGQRASRPAATTAAARQPRTGGHATPRRRYHQRESTQSTWKGIGSEDWLSDGPVKTASARQARPATTTAPIAVRSRGVRAERSCQIATSAAAAHRQRT